MTRFYAGRNCCQERFLGDHEFFVTSRWLANGSVFWQVILSIFEKSLPKTSSVPRRMRLSRLAGLAIALLFGASVAERLRAQDSGRLGPTSLSLPRLFANGMVVQREKPVAVWGWAAPGAKVTVDFRGKRVALRAIERRHMAGERSLGRQAARSNWLSSPERADRVPRRARRRRVGRVGPIEHGVQAVAGGEWRAKQIAAAHDRLLRQFKVPNSWSNTPEDDVVGGELDAG